MGYTKFEKPRYEYIAHAPGDELRGKAIIKISSSSDSAEGVEMAKPWYPSIAGVAWSLSAIGLASRLLSQGIDVGLINFLVGAMTVYVVAMALIWLKKYADENRLQESVELTKDQEVLIFPDYVAIAVTEIFYRNLSQASSGQEAVSLVETRKLGRLALKSGSDYLVLQKSQIARVEVAQNIFTFWPSEPTQERFSILLCSKSDQKRADLIWSAFDQAFNAKAKSAGF